MDFGQPLDAVKGPLTLTPYVPIVRPNASGALAIAPSGRIPHDAALRFATLGMSVVASAAALDAERILVVSLMLKPHFKSVAQMFAAVLNPKTKRDMVEASAHGTLEGTDALMFDALMKRVEALESHRNRLAHSVWAHADELPGRLVLLHPSRYVPHAAQGRPTRRLLPYPLGWPGMFRVIHRLPDLSGIERKQSWSYSEEDLDRLIGTCEVTLMHLHFLGMLLSREPGSGQARPHLSFLLPDPPKETPRSKKSRREERPR